MAKMHKLTKGGQTIYPATIYDAVVNPKTRKSLATELSEIDYKASSAADGLQGFDYNLNDYDKGIQYRGTSVGEILVKVDSPTTYSKKISVASGQVIKVSGVGASLGRLWYQTDNALQIIALADANTKGTCDVVIKPNATLLFVNTNDVSLAKIQSESMIKTLNNNEIGIKSLNRAVNGILFDIDDYEEKKIYQGSEEGSVLTQDSASGWYSLVIDVSEKEVYKITGAGGGTTRLWYQTDDSMRIVTLADANIKGTYDVTIKSGVTKLVLNSSASMSPLCLKTGILSDLEKLEDVLSPLPKRIDDLSISVSSGAKKTTKIEILDGYAQRGFLFGEDGENIAGSSYVRYKIPIIGGKNYALKGTLSTDVLCGAYAFAASSSVGSHITDFVHHEGTVSYDVVVRAPDEASYLFVSGDAKKWLSLYELEGLYLTADDQKNNNIENIRSGMINFTSLLGQLMAGKDIYINIGLIGDSWTQGVPNSKYGETINTYAKYLARLLQKKYGNGGLGWLDLAFGNQGKCADDEQCTISTSGGITYSDAKPSSLGISCSHASMSSGAVQTITFNDDVCDRAVIYFYKNASFTYSVNDEESVPVMADSTTDWQSVVIENTNIKKIVITATANNCIILGLDCYKGSRGIRVHKIGNRGITAAQYLAMDTELWKEGISKLNLCYASILLGINDTEKSTDYKKVITTRDNINAMFKNIKSIYSHIDLSFISVYDVKDESYVLLPKLSVLMYDYCKQEGINFLSTKDIIGGDKSTLMFYDNFIDNLHLDKAGCMLLAEYINNFFFNVK